MTTIELYRFKVGDPIAVKWRQTRHHATVDDIKIQPGEGNYEILLGTKEIQTIYPTG